MLLYLFKLWRRHVADARDQVEIIQACKRAILLPVLHNCLCATLADTFDRLKMQCARSVQIKLFWVLHGRTLNACAFSHKTWGDRYCSIRPNVTRHGWSLRALPPARDFERTAMRRSGDKGFVEPSFYWRRVRRRPADLIAATMVPGVIGDTRSSAPSSFSASLIAFVMAAGGAMAPPSPKPFCPKRV